MNHPPPSAAPLAGGTGVRHPKLASLLVLSSGALALVPAVEAQIIWSGPLEVKVGFGVGDSTAYTLDLPGVNDVLIKRIDPGYRNVYVAGNGLPRFPVGTAGAATGVLIPVVAGKKWGTMGVAAYSDVIIGSVNPLGNTVIGQPSFSHQYMLFTFPDSTAGNALRYGWAELSSLVGVVDSPSVTIHSWAYDASGAEIAAAAVPEPRTAALATGAALVLGAAGLRAWRQRRPNA